MAYLIRSQVEHKSEKMMQKALANDWKAQVKPTIPPSNLFTEIVWDLYCVRDKETLYVQWTGNRLTNATYSFCGTKSHPTHSAACYKLIEGQPSLKDVVKKKRSHNKDYDQIVDDLGDSLVIPFNLDWPALDILKAVIGRDIVWVRQIDGMVCSGFVPRIQDTNPKYLRVISARSSGRRILEWSDAEGFHAVALEQIIEVA